MLGFARRPERGPWGARAHDGCPLAHDRPLPAILLIALHRNGLRGTILPCSRTMTPIRATGADQKRTKSGPEAPRSRVSPGRGGSVSRRKSSRNFRTGRHVTSESRLCHAGSSGWEPWKRSRTTSSEQNRTISRLEVSGPEPGSQWEWPRPCGSGWPPAGRSRPWSGRGSIGSSACWSTRTASSAASSTP